MYAIAVLVWIVVMWVVVWTLYFGPGSQPSPCYGSWC
jgi:hypothetical protein